jgi:hypothetical protein
MTMRKTITLNTLRKVERAEEAMLRAVMPLTSAKDPEPLESNIRPAARIWSAGSLITKTGFTLAEVLR